MTVRQGWTILLISSEEDCMEASVMEEAHKLVDRLPESASWKALMREIYVRGTIKQGLADGRADRTTSMREVRANQERWI